MLVVISAGVHAKDAGTQSKEKTENVLVTGQTFFLNRVNSIQMSVGKIKSIIPERAIPGGEISIECEGFHTESGGIHSALLDGERCRIIAASSRRVLATLPSSETNGKSSLLLESGGVATAAARINVGRLLAGEMHIVANPAIDPKDDSLIFTRSGSRGQQLSSTLFRLETDGYLDELPVEMMNPTGIAFDSEGEMYVTNRADGQVCRIERGEEAVVYATGLGIATGIAFDKSGVMYVGDRSGTIYKIPEPALPSPFATLEASVAAYHMAFGPDGRLFVTAPGLASHDAVYAIDVDGNVDRYFRGLGRPQGLAFDTKGNLYVAACYQGRHGIVRIADSGETAEMFVAGNNVVGLCFTRSGEMVVATNDSVFSLNVGIYGTLLQ
jgi:sugar lactone lactonase YvrE